MMKINMVSMGCSKALVDSEKLMYQLVQNGSQVFFEQDGVFDAVIINTCGFIADAKEESVEMIFQKIAEKHAGKTTFVIVMGCLTQRYAEEIRREIPEIDAVFGVDEPEKVIQWLSAKENIADRHKRVITTPSHYAWLKIAEGCNRQCSFCAIPAIRGRQISLPVEDIIKEALFLRDRGVKEILLVAQDLTAYGTDRYHSNKLAALLRELENIDGLEWIRLHYAYPANFPDEVIEVMARSKKICNYLDIPFQHASDAILKAMARGHTLADSYRLISKIRNKIPDIALRTTLITGFPNESEEDFRALCQFVKTVKFDRLGVFTYSEEEGTPAAAMKDNIPEEVKKLRAEKILEIQEELLNEKNQSFIGKSVEVMIDRFEDNTFIGRTSSDAPEVDNEVIVRSNIALKTGTVVVVKITGAFPFGLEGVV